MGNKLCLYSTKTRARIFHHAWGNAMNKNSANTPYSSSHDFLTTREAADKLGLSLGTVQKMVEQGELVAWKTSGGHRRIRYDSVSNYLNMNCNLAHYDSRDFISLMQVVDTAEQRMLQKEIVTGWGLPVRTHFVEDVFHMLLRLLQVAPDMLILDYDELPCDGLALLRSLKGHSSLHGTDIVLISDMRIEKIHPASTIPANVVTVPKPLSHDLLRGFLSAKVAAKGI